MPKFKRHFTAESIENQVCDNTDELEKLGKLHEEGVLTDEEFAAKKRDILDN